MLTKLDWVRPIRAVVLADYAGGSLGAFGRSVSQACVVIHSAADSLDVKLPK